MVLEQLDTDIPKRKKKEQQQKKNLNFYLTPYKKINSKRIIDLNIKPVTTTYLEEIKEENLYDLGL